MKQPTAINWQPHRRPYPSVQSLREDQKNDVLSDPDYKNALLIDEIQYIQRANKQTMGPRIRRMSESRNNMYPHRDVTVMSLVFWYHVIETS